MLHQIKAQQFYTDLGLYHTENSRIQGPFKAFLNDFLVLFKADLFQRTFQESPINSSTFQTCANSGLS